MKSHCAWRTTASMDPTTASMDPTTASMDPTTASMDPTTASMDPTTASMDPTKSYSLAERRVGGCAAASYCQSGWNLQQVKSAEITGQPSKDQAPPPSLQTHTPYFHRIATCSDGATRSTPVVCTSYVPFHSQLYQVAAQRTPSVRRTEGLPTRRWPWDS